MTTFCAISNKFPASILQAATPLKLSSTSKLQVLSQGKMQYLWYLCIFSHAANVTPLLLDSYIFEMSRVQFVCVTLNPFSHKPHVFFLAQFCTAWCFWGTRILLIAELAVHWSTLWLEIERSYCTLGSKDKGRDAVSETLRDRVAQLPTSQKLSIKTACGVNSLTLPSSHPLIFGNYLLLLEPNWKPVG